MFTVKVFYVGGQSALMECEHVNISNDRRRLSLMGPGERGDILELEGNETVYIENSNGKTVDVIKPQGLGNAATPAAFDMNARPVPMPRG